MVCYLTLHEKMQTQWKSFDGLIDKCDALSEKKGDRRGFYYGGNEWSAEIYMFLNG